MKFQDTFNEFLESAAEDAIIKATELSWATDTLHVEMLPTGHWVLHTNIGNLYESKGLLVRIPVLSDDEWDLEENERYFENALSALECNFAEKLELFNEVQHA